jgi:hypothetical protein
VYLKEDNKGDQEGERDKDVSRQLNCLLFTQEEWLLDCLFNREEDL